jgi:hypothetical protein
MRDRSKLRLPSARSEEDDSKPSTGSELVAAIQESGLVGMWADREDLGDSRGFARRLRKESSKRKVSARASARH